jgi:hypothetical protein
MCRLLRAIYGDFAIIETGHPQVGSGSISKLGNKAKRELKRLKCSINYDSKFETSSHAGGKERCSLVFKEKRWGCCDGA